MYVSLPLLPAAYLYSDCAYRVFKAIMMVVGRLRLRDSWIWWAGGAEAG